MKSYYQQKKGGWDLEPVVYAKTVKQIRCYRFFQQVIGNFDNTSPMHQKESHLENKIVAEQYIAAIDNGLRKYVPEAYQDAVFTHLVDEIEYEALEEVYFLSTPAMKKYTQVFVWGVAAELGENFKI